MELQRAAEEVARLDPTKGPNAPGPENDGDEGSTGTALKARDELPAPTPFKI